MKDVVRFRVYPGRRTPRRYRHDNSRYFTVHCFRTERQMFQGAKMLRPEDRPRADFVAIVMSLERHVLRKCGKRRRWVLANGSLGDVLFHRKRLGCGIIAHEALHMALVFLRSQHRSRFQLTDPEQGDETEEELASIVEVVVRQICNSLIRQGVWKAE